MKQNLANAILIIGLIFFPVYSKAEPVTVAVTAIAGEQTVTSIIESLKQSINEIIDKTDTVVNKRTFDVRSHLIVVSQNLDVLAKGLVDTTFDKLTEQQQLLLTNTQNILNQFKNGNLEQIDALRALTGDFESALSVIPFSKNFPIIREYQPSYVALGDKDHYVIKINGSWLSNGNPVLRFPNGDCSRIARTDRELQFRCAKDAFNDIGSEIGITTGFLTVYEKMGAWDRLQTFFGVEPKGKKYEIALGSLPELLGVVDVFSVNSITTSEINNRSEGFDWMNPHCHGPKEACESFNQTNAQWKIIPGSININCHNSSKSSCLGVRAKTESGFQVCGHIANSGECVKVFGKIVAKDGRGHVWGSVSWQEAGGKTSKETTHVSNSQVYWGKDALFELPENSIAFQARVTQANGKTIIVSKPGDYGWFVVEKPPKSSSLIIRPKSVDVALRTEQ